MAKRSKQKESIKTVVSEPAISDSKKDVFKNWKWIVFAIGFLLYANTANFEYALDDKIVIITNQITTQGIGSSFDHFFYDSMDGFWAQQYGVDVSQLNKDALVAGGRYRPLSLFTFSIEYGLFGESPGISHVINALLYGLTGLVLFMLLLKLFPVSSASQVLKSIPFWTTVLFLVHPLHVEVVANIKSRDEILSFLFGIWALIYLIDYAKTKEFKPLIISGLLLFLSLLSKETTIAFVAIGPLMLYFFEIGEKQQWRMAFLGLLSSGVIYTLIRYSIIGAGSVEVGTELMNNPFLNASEGEKFATIFLILAAYIKLLFFPFPLTHDYYPYHLPFLADEEHYANWGSVGAIIGVVLMIGLIIVIVRGFKSRSIYAFCALLFLGTSILISNLFFPIGVFMNERFMYIPSLAWALGLTYFVFNLVKVKDKEGKMSPLVMGLGVVAVIFAGVTFNRSYAWESDLSLALADIEVSAGSAKMNMSAGDALLKNLPNISDEKERTEAINQSYIYLKRALDIYPTYFPPLDLLGTMYFEAGNYQEAIKFYGYCADRKPGNPQFVENIFIIGNKLVSELKYDEATRAYDVALAYSPSNKQYLLTAAEVFIQKLQNPSRAISYMERAHKYYPEDPNITEKLGINYAMLRRFDDAIAILEPLLQQYPQNASIMKNLGIAYYQAGDEERGSLLVAQSEQLAN